MDNPAINWKSVVTTLLVGKYAFETYIRYRQYLVYQRTEPPVSIQKEISAETFAKSQDYSRAKSKFAFVSEAVDLLTTLGSIKFDLLPRLWSFSGSVALLLSRVAYIGRVITSSVMTQSLVFLAVTTLISAVDSLPLSYYQNFVLEERFGFNKMTIKIWFTDKLKDTFVSLALMTPFMWGLLKIIDAFGVSFVSYACAFVLVFQLVVITIYQPLIMPLFYKLTPLEDGELKTEIETLAEKNKFPLTSLYVIDGSTRSAHSNAFFLGLPWKKTIILFDTLVENNTTNETVAVLGHEIGHWKLNHVPQHLVAGQISLAATFVLFTAFLNNKSLYQSFGFSTGSAMIGFTLFSFVSSPLNCVTQFAMNALIRKNEYQADAFAKEQGYKEDLAAALIKLCNKDLTSLNADWLYSAYHDSHPILADRLSALGYVSKEKVGNLKVDVSKEKDE